MPEKHAGPAGVEAARRRARIYDLLLTVFRGLPDEALLQKMGDEGFRDFRDAGYDTGNLRLESGIRHVESYLAGIKSRTDAELLNELSVDRTRLLRGTGERGLKPPYECFYRGSRDRSGTVLAVKNFYRRAGLSPDEAIGEMVDYLCVELDFMYQLCLREAGECSSGGGAGATQTDEETFLREHLGSWIGAYCRQAERYARTEFYRGFFMVLDGFIDAETKYLQGLARPPEKLAQP